ncbi:hypothetical protein [Paenibacillus sp. JCM 10914]|uniref:hypothetical protein n=1 Tax=Paenibacillus sp. JCM 10914 TaxID=1236974 RepID=UPI0003CC96DF|nr:hypothetical protein [Paenibacillus sp. JCM 10914]GAE05186.1 hypothetical protein JCM10914_1277 [Paenibacillus sp. JCM 10914]
MASLPAWERIEEWNCHADIHILSNHCSEWVGALLEPLKHFTKSITISNQVGLCKPEIEIYEFVSRYFPAGISSNRILYIDDQDKNLRPAKMLGWNTMLADQEQRWIEGVNEWLGTQA